ncbi:PLD-like domain-containing protein [Serratia symbiotica]|nr:PLD-like domain-containing protein [Serratia symbiotica]
MSKINKKNIITFLCIIIFIFPILASTNLYDIEVGFSPGKTAKKIILKAIEEAKISIDVAAYSFTSKPIALAIVNAYEHGINVRIIADKKSNSGRYTAITYIANHKVPVRLNDKYSIMHNKFMIIDNNSLETGSFNYTKNATLHNAENVIYLRNKPDITKKYLQEFNRLWDESIDIKNIY